MSRSSVVALAVALAACGSPSNGTRAGPDDPIEAPAEQWTWVDFPDSQCANGTPTGIGIDPTARSEDLVIYFQGGGACWDDFTCIGLRSASNLTGYGSADFSGESVRSAAFFDRGSPPNPFRDASFVFVPYCTADLHAGDAVRDYSYYGLTRTLHHAGARNTALYLRRLAATFPHVRRVFATGSSAGGYSAQLNFERIAAAFPGAEVHALADGAQLVQPAGTRYAEWQAAWNLAPPPGCAECATEISAMASWLAASHPDSRFALLASAQDVVLTAYFGLSSEVMDAETRSLLSARYAPYPNAHYFALPGGQHTMLAGLDQTIAADGTALSLWLQRWFDGDPAWRSTGP